MAPIAPSTQFRDWLADAIETSGLKKREIARRMASKHPRGVNTDTIETGRRTINKILSGASTPTQPTRDSIAEALGRDDHPSVAAESDDEEDDLPSVLLTLARERAELLRLITRLDRTMARVSK